MTLKNLIGAAGAIVASVFAVNAQAAGWVLVQGVQATQIGVGAGNRPWIKRQGGAVQYAQKGLACGNGICVESLDWINADLPGFSSLAVNLNGDAFAFANGQFWYYRWDTQPGVWRQLPASNGCVTRFAVSRMQSAGGAPTYVFPTPISAPSGSQSQNIANIWGIGDSSCGVGILQSWPINLTFSSSFSGGWHWDTTQWTPADVYYKDTSPTPVIPAMFSAMNGVFEQSLWIASAGIPWASKSAAETHPLGSYGYNQVAKPKIGSTSYNVTYLTDSYAIAGNKVFSWGGDIFGNTMFGVGWRYMADAPAGRTLLQIAYARELWSGEDIVAGPSQLWAIDNQYNLYYYSSNDTGGVK